MLAVGLDNKPNTLLLTSSGTSETQRRACTMNQSASAVAQEVLRRDAAKVLPANVEEVNPTLGSAQQGLARAAAGADLRVMQGAERAVMHRTGGVHLWSNMVGRWLLFTSKGVYRTGEHCEVLELDGSVLPWTVPNPAVVS